MKAGTPEKDEAGAASPKAEALRELAHLADFAACGEGAVLTRAARKFMKQEAARLWRRFAQESRRVRAS